ncbi:hypothetical protein DICPUDRAFT_151613 [Dictyostelium purpureum]|uniref:Uncharacterized protein n=1 Tax=Dictyostelium purpureum TaxID=5786 RepID=F0ZJA4_DICPU|nr:uncharacterized protein DICPUDRAFT_151613 [Dictyostelium purpureum]EGC35984.1 hypothetical protein DICPUDRAFT_151613 [Dictyostelium purpureum]|eukprot:XP_003287485.1 hypothetical protein DICPUDRAFT_151613 [Dictyostelium purpureum]
MIEDKNDLDVTSKGSGPALQTMLKMMMGGDMKFPKDKYPATPHLQIDKQKFGTLIKKLLIDHSFFAFETKVNGFEQNLKFNNIFESFLLVNYTENIRELDSELDPELDSDSKLHKELFQKLIGKYEIELKDIAYLFLDKAGIRIDSNDEQKKVEPKTRVEVEPKNHIDARKIMLKLMTGVDRPHETESDFYFKNMSKEDFTLLIKALINSDPDKNHFMSNDIKFDEDGKEFNEINFYQIFNSFLLVNCTKNIRDLDSKLFEEWIGIFNVKAQDLRTFQMKTTFLGCPYASTNSKRNAFTLFCKDISITICNVDHLENETRRKYIRNFLGFRNNDKQSFKVPEDHPLQIKCRGCPASIDDSLKIRGLKLPKIDSNFFYFCSIECFYTVCSIAKGGDFAELINPKKKKGDSDEEVEDEIEKDNKESKKKKNKEINAIVTRPKRK